MKQSLKVVYDGGKLDEKLDDQIRAFFTKLGFENWASGMHLTNGERDLAFDREV